MTEYLPSTTWNSCLSVPIQIINGNVPIVQRNGKQVFDVANCNPIDCTVQTNGWDWAAHVPKIPDFYSAIITARNDVMLRGEHNGCDRFIVSLEYSNRMDRFSKVPKPKSEVTAGSGEQFLTGMSRTTGQLLVMAFKLV